MWRLDCNPIFAALVPDAARRGGTRTASLLLNRQAGEDGVHRQTAWQAVHLAVRRSAFAGLVALILLPARTSGPAPARTAAVPPAAAALAKGSDAQSASAEHRGSAHKRTAGSLAAPQAAPAATAAAPPANPATPPASPRAFARRSGRCSRRSAARRVDARRAGRRPAPMCSTPGARNGSTSSCRSR